MSEGEDLRSVLKARERSRSLVRVATLTVGAGALAIAGIVAYLLPSPPQRTSATTVAPSASPPGQQGEDGAGEDGGNVPAPAATPAGTPSHATTGGS